MSKQFTLVLGDRSLSSWSMRAWLMAKMTGIDFETKFISLYQDDTRTQILKYSPSGKVPALIHGDLCIWDSMAIGEYLNELMPDCGLYPSSIQERALARSIANEMHSGFTTIRNTMPFTFINQAAYKNSVELQKEIARVEDIWVLQRRQYANSGKFLFGSFGLVDAMFAPVAIRFIKYGYRSKTLEVNQYIDSVLNHAYVQEWLM